MTTCPRHPERQTESGYQVCGRQDTDGDGRLYWTGCIGTLREDLRESGLILDHLRDLLDTRPPVDRDERRAHRTEGQAPCRLDILDLTDPRSDTPALALLSLWADNIVDGRGLTSRPNSPGDIARWIANRHLDWAARHPTAPEMCADLHSVHRWLKSAAGMPPQPPVFHCPVRQPGTDGECGGGVYPGRWSFSVRCGRCGATWEGHDQLRLVGLVLEDTPASPTPSTPTPASPTPASPTPSTPTPASPTPSTPTPASPTPASPTPSTPTPASPTPSTPTPGDEHPPPRRPPQAMNTHPRQHAHP